MSWYAGLSQNCPKVTIGSARKFAVNSPRQASPSTVKTDYDPPRVNRFSELMARIEQGDHAVTYVAEETGALSRNLDVQPVSLNRTARVLVRRTLHGQPCRCASSKGNPKVRTAVFLVDAPAGELVAFEARKGRLQRSGPMPPIWRRPRWVAPTTFKDGRFWPETLDKVLVLKSIRSSGGG
jgi:hypothetical protein